MAKENKIKISALLLIVPLAVLAILFLLSLYNPATTPRRATSMSCVNNMRQALLFSVMYLEDNEFLPDDIKRLGAENGVMDKMMFYCPETQQEFQVIRGVTGKKSPDMPLFIESLPSHHDNNKQIHIGYLDGSVRPLKLETVPNSYSELLPHLENRLNKDEVEFLKKALERLDNITFPTLEKYESIKPD